MEAPENGYQQEWTGVAPLEQGVRSNEETVRTLELSRGFFFRKGHRYGVVNGLEFKFVKKPLGEQRRDTEKGMAGERILVWEVKDKRFVVQARPMGHRMLVPRKSLEQEPPWAKGR